MTPEEKTRLERLLADASAQDPLPDRLRPHVFAEADGLPVSRTAERRPSRLRLEWWPLLAAGVLFSVIIWRVLDVQPPPAETPGQARPQELVQRLGAEDVRVREAAAAELLALGEKARATLEVAATSGDSEVRQRAQGILAALDLRTRVATVSRHAFALGESGVLCVEAAAFDLLGDERNLPDSLKAALLSPGGLTLGIVVLEEGRVGSSEIKTVALTGTSAGGPLLLCRQAFGPPTNQATIAGRGAPAHPLGPWSREAKPLRGTELFRLWPQLRRQSLVFLVPMKPNERSETLRKGLEAAVSHERPHVRAGALHLLRHYAQTGSVETALRKLEDGVPLVRDTAKETLLSLVKAPEGSAEETRAWWASLDAKRKTELLEQSRAQLAVRPCLCESNSNGR